MEIKWCKIEDVKPYAKNAKLHDKTQIANVAESIKQFGWQQPIVVDTDGVIIAGHCRYSAAKKLKMKEVPCVVADNLSDEQVKKYRLLDNKTNESDWDLGLLSDDLEGLDFSGFDVDWGITSEEEEPDVVEDDFEVEVPENPKAKLGQIYQLGRHRLMCGDSTKQEDVEKLMGGKLADMLLTDPPYNVNYEGSAGKIKNDNMDESSFREFLRSAFSCAKENIKPGAAFHIWHAESEGYNFRGACRDVGLKVRQCLIWVKNSLVLGRQDFQWKHEPCLYGEKPMEESELDEYDPCLYGWKEGSAHRWFKNRRQTTILQFDKPVKSKEHPTMKPILLFNYEMQCNSKPGEIVLDLFGGSGTTIMACEQNGRIAYTMEFDPKYVDVIIERWEKFTGKKAVLLNG